MSFIEIFKNALPIIEHSAPMIASALMNPAGGLASGIVTLLGNVFGVESSDPQAIADAIVNHPQANDKLAALNQQHGAWLNKILTFLNQQPTSAEINIKLNWDKQG